MSDPKLSNIVSTLGATQKKFWKLRVMAWLQTDFEIEKKIKTKTSVADLL